MIMLHKIGSVSIYFKGQNERLCRIPFMGYEIKNTCKMKEGTVPVTPAASPLSAMMMDSLFWGNRIWGEPKWRG